eukprot:4806728-Ditylum_brightwellii.AAC.1
MGNIIERSDVRSGPSGLKFKWKKIVDYIGKVDDLQKWKNCTQCAFNGSRQDEKPKQGGFLPIVCCYIRRNSVSFGEAA